MKRTVRPAPPQQIRINKFLSMCGVASRRKADELLNERAGQPVSSDEILSKIWGLEASPTNRTVDNFIVKLRKKLEAHPDKPKHILTVYGFGYKLAV